MVAAGTGSISSDPTREAPPSLGEQGPEAPSASAANEAQAKLELEARKVTDAVNQARSKYEASHAALARLEAEVDLPPSATDAQIKDHLLATDIARVRFRQSERSLDTAEAACKLIHEQVTKLARDDARREAIADQAEIVARCRSEYPEVVNKLLRLFAEAHAIESMGAELNKNLAEGDDPYVSAFLFTDIGKPTLLRVQVIGGSGEVMWQGDQNSDVASQQI